jgi:hypothetical protein
MMNQWIYVSTNGGASWASNSFPAQNLFTLACSADGTKVVAGCFPGSIYTSTDSGTTWISNSAPSKSWISVVCSADGNRLAAVAAAGGGIYTQQTTPTPMLRLLPSGGSLLLSWTVPSMNFVLQKSSELTGTNWTDVTAARTLNYENLQYQVSVPITSEAMFYRLVSR